MQHTVLIFTENETRDSVLKKLPRDIRRNIQKAIDNDLELIEARDSDDYSLFYEKFKEFSKKKGFAIKNLSFYKQFKLFLCFYQDFVAGFALVDENKDSYGFVMIFQDESFDYVNPTYFMYYFLIIRAIENHKKYIDLAGYSAGLFEGIDEFKKRWISKGLGVVILFPETLKDRISKRLPILNKIWQRMKMMVG